MQKMRQALEIIKDFLAGLWFLLLFLALGATVFYFLAYAAIFAIIVLLIAIGRTSRIK